MDQYDITAMPIDAMTAPQLRDPVLSGPGAGEMEWASDGYRAVAELLTTACADVQAILNAAKGAHEGAAAVGANYHGMRVVAVGELLSGQASIAHETLNDSIGYHLRVRQDMEALPEVRTFGGAKGANATQQDVEALDVAAADAAHRYEDNNNFAAQRRLQPFEATEIAPPGSGAGVAASWGSSAAAAAQPAAFGGAGTAGPGPGGPGAGGPAVPVGGAAGPVVAAPGVGGAGGVAGPGVGAGSGRPGGGGPGGGPAGARGAGAPGSTGRVGPVSPGTAAGTGSAASPARGGRAVPPGVRPATGPDPDSGHRPDRSAADARSGAPAGNDPRGGGPGGVGRPDPGAGTGGGSGWMPGTPWSTRPNPGATPVLPPTEPVPGRGATPGAPAGAAPGAGPRPGVAHAPGMPFMAGAGAGQNGETEHKRPPYLLMDDPDAFWFAGMPGYGPGVIGGDTP